MKEKGMKEKGMKEEKESQGVMWFCGSAVPWFCSFEADIEFCGCVGSVDLQLCAFVWVSWAWK